MRLSFPRKRESTPAVGFDKQPDVPERKRTSKYK